MKKSLNAMLSEKIDTHLQELEWTVNKGFDLRHLVPKAFHPFVIQDAITLIRIYRNLKRP